MFTAFNACVRRIGKSQIECWQMSRWWFDFGWAQTRNVFAGNVLRSIGTVTLLIGQGEEEGHEVADTHDPTVTLLLGQGEEEDHLRPDGPFGTVTLLIGQG